MSRLTRFALSTIAAAAFLGLAGAPAAHASTDQRSIMQDDDLLIYRNDATRDAALQRMKLIGVDTIRVTVLWSALADNAISTPERLKRFRERGADDPKAYPALGWDRYDRLVLAAQAYGLEVYFDVTGPGPAFGMTKPPKKYRRDAKWWRPKPREFYKFVQAVGKRYSGSYVDTNGNHAALPRVSFWSIWNEPNQGGWLRPQWLGGKPVSPGIYRELFRFGRRALVSTGHGNDTILLGETAPRAVARRTTTSAMGPRVFVNELLCGPGHRGAGCSSFQGSGPLLASGFAHHPYTRTVAPDIREPNPDTITLANIGDLATLLDQDAAATGNIAPNLPIYSTEFGYETNAPDPFAKVTPQQQADFMSLSEGLTYFNPRVVSTSQFLLRDVKPDRSHKKNSKEYWATYQSGIYTAGGTPKPAAQSYLFPLLTIPAAPDPATGAPQAFFFGQLRFRDNLPAGQAGDPVTLQWKPADGSADWTTFNTVPTDARGYFALTLPIPGPGLVRGVWNGSVSPFNFTSLPRGV